MSLRERLTNIIRKISTEVDKRQSSGEDPVLDINTQNSEKKTTKSLGPMVTRVILGRYEVPSHNPEDGLK